ncbi:MAG TPA: HlyD family efflux transporter periplasmic adaptor subunit [Patescibacteria group bacterium]|nr:HlyD family efflux transporter periplasmic adaptor subunit [Patescibacteria group bacterium]
MKDRKKLIIIASIVLIVVVLGAVRIISSGKDKIKEVDIGKVETRNLSQTISVTGNIEASGKEEISLPTQQKVLEIFVQEGNDVKAGDAILRIDSTDNEYQLKKYELALELANIDLQRLLTSGSKNNKKTLEDAVRTAEIELSTTETNFNEAKRKYDQNRVLYESGAVSKEDFEASLQAMNEYKNKMELSTIQLDNARNSLKDFGINNSDQIKTKRSQVESSKADIANIKSQIEKSTIKSSINGKIVQLDVQNNQYPTMENNTIAIYDLSKHKVKVQVSQYDAVTISKGQKSVIRVKGIDKEYKGTVTDIGDAAIITLEGTNKEPKVELEITLDNPDDKVKVGYEADIDITLKESPSAIAVSFESVLEDKDGKKYIFLVDKNKAVQKFVTTGLETDFDIQILEGIKVGDQYIKNPPTTLKDGDPVKQSGGKNSDNKS